MNELPQCNTDLHLPSLSSFLYSLFTCLLFLLYDLSTLDQQQEGYIFNKSDADALWALQWVSLKNYVPSKQLPLQITWSDMMSQVKPLFLKVTACFQQCNQSNQTVNQMSKWPIKGAEVSTTFYFKANFKVLEVTCQMNRKCLVKLVLMQPVGMLPLVDAFLLEDDIYLSSACTCFLQVMVWRLIEYLNGKTGVLINLKM